MNFPNNTEWRQSAKGNFWRKKNGTMLIVGGSESTQYWARVGDVFLDEKFNDFNSARKAAENACR